MASIAGDIELMPCTDIVAWLANRRRTATLTVRRRDVECRFLVREGVCTQASSTDPREFLGQHLINFGYIDEEQLQRAFDTQKETRVPLGRVLVMVEALSQDQLQRVLTFKTREGLLEALCWTDGQWKLVPQVDDDRELDCLRPVDLREVCSEAAARQQMWGEIRRVFPSDATRCDVVDAALRPSSAFDGRLLALMAAGKTVGEAALELRAMDFQTYARLYDLANRKLLRPRTTTTEVSTNDLAQLAILQGFAVAAGPLGQAGAGAALDLPAFAPADITTGTRGLPAVVGEPVVELSGIGAGPATGDGAAGIAATLPRSPSGSFLLVRPEAPVESPGVVVPAEAGDPQQALRLALAGRSWGDAMLLAQRILERDPINAEAIAALRVADAQQRRTARDGADADMNRAPRLTTAREEIAQAHLSSKERYVLSRIDGKRTLQQIAAVSPISRAELLRIVDGFVARGVVTF
jgi:hypothetical protein